VRKIRGKFPKDGFVPWDFLTFRNSSKRILPSVFPNPNGGAFAKINTPLAMAGA
jgi:hypothetical protein